MSAYSDWKCGAITDEQYTADDEGCIYDEEGEEE